MRETRGDVERLVASVGNASTRDDVKSRTRLVRDALNALNLITEEGDL